MDCITRKSVWQEYCCNMLLFYGDQPKDTLSYAKLCALWDECFSNVKVRVYKNVSGNFLLTFLIYNKIIYIQF